MLAAPLIRTAPICLFNIHASGQPGILDVICQFMPPKCPRCSSPQDLHFCSNAAVYSEGLFKVRLHPLNPVMLPLKVNLDQSFMFVLHSIRPSISDSEVAPVPRGIFCPLGSTSSHAPVVVRCSLPLRFIPSLSFIKPEAVYPEASRFWSPALCPKRTLLRRVPRS
jgi:hypothetical protein